MSKPLVIWLSALSALVVLLVVLAGVIVWQNDRAAEQANLERIMGICTDQYGTLTDENLDRIVECSEQLLD